GDDPEKMHPEMAQATDTAIEKIKAIQKHARENNDSTRPIWPMIVFRAPKGWTGPKEWDGKPIENSFRAHQIPIPVDQGDMEHADKLVAWLKSYRPEELFDKNGALKPEIKATAPKGIQRMAANPITNGGLDPGPLKLPDWREYTLDNSQH